MRTIDLPCGRKALIDADDYAKIKHLHWYASGSEDDRSRGLYVVAGDARGRRVFLHRMIIDAPRGVRVDHKNHNTLDNRRANLRLATASQNAGNRRPNLRQAVPFKGVSLLRGRSYQAHIQSTYLGTFTDPMDAALAYDRAAVNRFGEFARINFDLSRDWIINGQTIGLHAPEPA